MVRVGGSKELAERRAQFSGLRCPVERPATDTVDGVAAITLRETDPALWTLDDIDGILSGCLILVTGPPGVELLDVASETVPSLAARSPTLRIVPQVCHMERRPAFGVDN